jgi:hypothetical protein
MGTLATFDSFLADRLEVAGEAETRLSTLLSKFESFFAEVSAVREAELGQLGQYVAAGPEKLPAWLAKALTATRAQVEKDFEDQLAVLELERADLAEKAEAIRKRSMADEAAVHQKNVDLDAAEEKLKARAEDLLAQIEAHNAKIREMGTGFGFFANFFQMRRLAVVSATLQKEQSDVAAQIDLTRAAWVDRESKWGQDEGELKKRWVEARTRVSAAQTKIDALKEARLEMIFRTTLERVLYERRPKEAVPVASDPKCPRCQSANPKESHFCQICGHRLLPDRPDLEGSLEEIAEANFHFARFSEGMKKCQEVLGLVRGLSSGLGAFRKSVGSMIDSQNKYPLAKLQLDVPAECVEYAKNLEALRDAASPQLSMHPKVFGERMEAVARPFGQEQVKAFFERMGAELSKAAKAQWG